MADVNIGPGVFPAGTKVQVYRRTGDFFAATDVLKSGRTDDTGVSLSGVDEGTVWVAGEVTDANDNTSTRAVRAVAKTTEAPRKRTKAPTSADPQRTPVASPGVEIVTGPKGTKVAGRTVEVPVPAGVEPHPHINQASVPDSTPQRSSTALGQGTPTDPREPQPKPRQQDVKKGVKQRSATELGEATPIVPEAGVDSQDDVKKSLKQRSNTEYGEATPIGSAEPRGTASNPDSREQAAGVRPTDTKKAATKKAATNVPAASKVKDAPRKGRPA